MAYSPPSTNGPDAGASAPSEDCATDPALPNHEARELAAAHLGGLAQVAAVLSEQLDGVQAQTGEAARGLVTRTNGIDEQLRSLIGVLEKEAAQLLERSVEEGLQLREEQGALHMLERFLERSAAHARDGTEKAHLIDDAVASAAPVIAEMRELAMQSRVLAINAGIESARQRGAFTVIAQEVRRVSERSAAAVKLVQETIARVAALVGTQLSDATRQQHEEDASDRNQLKRFAALVARRAGEQQQREEARHRMLENVAEQHDQLRRHVVELLASVQCEDVTRQRIDGVRKALADMELVLKGLVSALGAPEGWSRLPAVLDAGRLLEDYVMTQQREAHMQAVGGQSEADGGPRIELF